MSFFSKIKNKIGLGKDKVDEKTETQEEAAESHPLEVQEEAGKEDSEVIKSIVDTETSEGEERILEEAPEIDVSLLQEVEPPKSIILLFLKILFTLLILSGFTSLLFFLSQLTDKLDFAVSTFGIPNISQQLASSNSEIVSLQTNLNFYRYLQTKAYLDQFTYFGDSYIQNYKIANSQTADPADVKIAEDSMNSLRESLRKTFFSIKDKYIYDFSVPLVSTLYPTAEDLENLYKQKLMEQLKAVSAEVKNSLDPEAQRNYKNYQYTIKLIGNTKLSNLIVKTDFDSLSEQELYNFINNLNDLIINDLTVIQDIKEKRIKWSDIIDEIDLRTMAVDIYYSGDYYNEIGGIRYSSYNFDGAGTVSITGETKRFDTTNFTMIANLIDELNRSKLFGNAEMRSFSKAGSFEDGFTASLKLTLDLKREEVVEDNTPIATEQPEILLDDLTL